MKHYDSGRSMIEMMGVLVIIGALSAGGIAGYTKALHQNKVKKAIEQINVISGHLSAIGANGGNYNRLTNTTAIKMKAVLPEMVTGAETLTNPFSGIVEIKESKLLSGSQEGQAYTIKYTGLDNQACLSLATNDWGSSKNSSLIGIAAGNGAIDNFYLNCKGNKNTSGIVQACTKGDNTKSTEVGIPMPVSEATPACGGCGSSNCSIILKYY